VLRSADHEVVGVASIGEDITEYRQALTEVQRQLKQLEGLRAVDQAILEGRSREAIAAIGLRHLRELVPFWGAAVRLFDYAADQALLLNVTRPQGSAFDPVPSLTLDEYGRDEIALLRAGSEQIVATVGPTSIASDRVRRLHEIGMRSYVAIPLLAEGDLVGVMNLANDKTGAYTTEEIAMARSMAEQMAIALSQTALREQVQRHAIDLERRVEERTAELKAANRELESFAATVSHDLRGPARRMGVFAQMVIKDAGGINQDSLDMLERIVRSSQGMGDLIDDLLSLALTSSQKLEKASVDMNALVRKVLEELDPPVKIRAIEWHIADLPEGYCDASLVGVVMRNLVDNAVKYTSKKSNAVIEVGSRQLPGGETEFFVRDNGAGFDMRSVGKLFEAFSRLHSKNEFEGTGIGLATVQRIISRHGGRVWAEGSVEKGATFYFTLPDVANRPA
jgi:signal transduction histidine kinase